MDQQAQIKEFLASQQPLYKTSNARLKDFVQTQADLPWFSHFSGSAASDQRYSAPTPRKKPVWPWILVTVLLVLVGLGGAWAMGLIGPKPILVASVKGIRWWATFFPTLGLLTSAGTVTVWWLGLPLVLGVPLLFGVLRKEAHRELKTEN